jgi:hypothetical protein
MANACACGCGQLLPENSTRQYKRGHKNKVPVIDDEYTEVPSAEDPDALLAEIAQNTPDDPEPQSPVPEYKPRTTIRVTASVRRDVEGKLALLFGIMGQTWSLADPLCGTALAEAGPDMAKKYMPLICQSPDIVKWMTKGGNFLLWIDAIMATWPVIQAIFAHHIAKTATWPASPNGMVPHADYVVQ